jgi:hypothetical protein
MIPKLRRPSKNLKTLYIKYLKDNPKGSENFLELYEFKKASILIFQEVVDSIFKGKRVTLPYGLGVLYLDTFELKGKKIDFGASNKIGKVVYHTNLHSDGKTYKLKWYKVSSRFKNKKMFKFKLNRSHSRKLASLIKNNKIKIFKRYV